GLPVVPVSDLRAVAQRASLVLDAGRALASDPRVAPRHILVCNDARMHEVYWGCFEQATGGLVTPVVPERVSKPSDVQLPEGWVGTSVHAAGRGFGAYAELGQRLAAVLATVHSGILPAASEIAVLAAAEARAGRTVAPEQAVPVYLRDDVARPKGP